MARVSLRNHLEGPAGPYASTRQAIQATGESVPQSLRDLLAELRPAGTIWRGFDHRWEYNHRLNRFGSYVRSGSDGWTVGHSAASGTGTDTAHFRDRYTVVQAPGVRFAAGVGTVRIRGGEAERLHFSEDVTTSLAVPIDDDTEWTVVLNGFDLVSEADADKLMHFDVGIESATTTDGGASVKATIGGSFEAACQTPECEGGDGSVDYTLRVHCLVVSGEPDAFNVGGSTRVRNAYEWDIGGSDEEIHASNLGHETAAVDAGNWPAARNTLAFESLSIDAERMEPDGITHPALANAAAVHLLGWDTAIDEIDVNDGRVTGDALLFFKNWEQGMKGARFLDSKFSLKDAGRATFDVSLKLLQFGDVDTHDRASRSDTLKWGGGGADAGGDNAVKEDDIGVY